MKYYKLSDICNVIHKKIANNKNMVILLLGPLGIGKTTLVKEIVNKIYANVIVTSPTYNIMHQYGNNIYHYDLYMKGIDYALDIGLLDLIGKEGVHFIEWGDEKLFNLLKKIGICVYLIRIKNNDIPSKSNINRLYEIEL